MHLQDTRWPKKARIYRKQGYSGWPKKARIFRQRRKEQTEESMHTLTHQKKKKEQLGNKDTDCKPNHNSSLQPHAQLSAPLVHSQRKERLTSTCTPVSSISDWHPIRASLSLAALMPLARTSRVFFPCFLSAEDLRRHVSLRRSLLWSSAGSMARHRAR